MKKILFATTALVASTGFAMADVDISGEAEMGIFGGERGDGSELDTQFHTDINVIFSMSGTTDNGLTFGAFVELDSDEDNDLAPFDPSESGSDTAIFVSGSLGTLTMGDTDGALDFSLTEAIIGSSIQDDHEHLGYNGNSGLDGTYDGQVARYDYEIAGFAVALSAEIDDDDDDVPDLGDGDFFDDLENEFSQIDNDTVLGIGVRYAGTYNAIDFGAGLGYQRAGMGMLVDDDGDGVFDDTDDSNAEVIGISADMSMENGFSGVINYSSYDNVLETEIGSFGPSDDALVSLGVPLDEHYGIAAGYEFGAFLVSANYGKFKFDGDAETSGYGIVANYDLGGGAELQGSWARNKYEADSDSLELIGAGVDLDDDAGEYDRFSFGIAMSF